MVSTDFDTLTLCPLLMDNIAGELGEDLAGGGVLAEGTRIDALQLYSLSLSWVHELLHWIPSVNCTWSTPQPAAHHGANANAGRSHR